MFCSLKVESKNKVDRPLVDGGPVSGFFSSKPRSNWEQVVDDATARWIREGPRIVTPRNVGGTRKNKWTAEEDARLANAIGRFGTDYWRKVSSMIPGRSAKQCRERWIAQLSPELVRSDWSPEEDLTLVQKQAQFGNQWAKIKDFLPGRSGIAAKNRWNWLSRRNIPKHSQEFEAIARSHSAEAVKQDEVVSPEGKWGDFLFALIGEQPFESIDFFHSW
jgi:hypothetical protein